MARATDPAVKALEQRITELEAQITQWHTWIEPTRDLHQLMWDLAFAKGRQSADPFAAAAARQPAPRRRRPGTAVSRRSQGGLVSARGSRRSRRSR